MSNLPVVVRSAKDLAAVLNHKLLIKTGKGLDAWKTAERLLSDIVNDGYDPYYIAIAIDYLVNSGRDPVPRRICSIPAMMAGFTAVAADEYRACWVYWRSLLDGDRLLSYDFWLDRLEDAALVENQQGVQKAKENLERILNGIS